MSLSSHKSVQAYLERNGIGKLFEDMMARLIKEMPNEPVNYLIKLLQKINQRRAASVGENTYPSSILYKSGMGLTGSSIPLKQANDPQIILPGSKQPASVWLADSTSGKELLADNIESTANMSRSYEKPWLAGSKQSKGTKDKKDLSKTDPPSWNTDIKSSKNVIVDDLLEQNNNSEVKKGIVSKSLTLVKENLRPKKTYQISMKDRNWSEGAGMEEKENSAPHSRSEGQSISGKNDLDNELKIASRPLSAGKKTVCSPQTYSKFKRKLSKKKSFENKQKLQALLLTDQTKIPKADDLDDSDYEGDEVFEDVNELCREGARSKTSSGMKHTHKSSSDNIKVSVCSRCAQMIGNNDLKPSNESLNMISSDNEDFSTVSQLDPLKSYKPVWSALNNETETDITTKTNPQEKSVLQNNKSKINRMADEEKSDFFEENNPLRNKTKRFAGDFISDESDDGGIILPKTKSWQQQLDGSGSDADVDDESQVLNLKGSRWKQKIANSNIASDI